MSDSNRVSQEEVDGILDWFEEKGQIDGSQLGILSRYIGQNAESSEEVVIKTRQRITRVFAAMD